MISQREVKKRYNKLMNDVKTKDFYKVDLTNRVNCYVCDCGHITKTKDIDSGVTPFTFTCEKCKGTAKSTFYNDYHFSFCGGRESNPNIVCMSECPLMAISGHSPV